MAGKSCDDLRLQSCLLHTDATLCSTLWCCGWLHCMMCRQAGWGQQRTALTLCHAAVSCLAHLSASAVSTANLGTQTAMEEMQQELRLPPTSSSLPAFLAFASFFRRLTSARLLWSCFSSSLSSSKGVSTFSSDSSLQLKCHILEASACISSLTWSLEEWKLEHGQHERNGHVWAAHL